MKSRAACIMALAMLMVVIGGRFELPGYAAGTSSTRQVTGKVIATVTEEQPRTIVLSTKAASEELVVGATVGDRVPIRRGTRSIPLDQIQVGETVQLKYQKTKAGLVAVSIAAK